MTAAASIPSLPPPGTGVRKMMSYADDLEAEMEITSKSNVGTVVRLWLPLVDPVEVLVIDRMKGRRSIDMERPGT